jgi:pimeloyl-ACP methyl ester carboxylesterase
MGGSSDDYLAFTMRFVDDGYRVFAVDFTGSGASQGDSIIGMNESALDLNAALHYCKTNDLLNQLPINIIGHSWGAFGAAAVLNLNDWHVNSVTTFAGFDTEVGIMNSAGPRLAGPVYYLIEPQLWVIQKMKFGDHLNLSGVKGLNKTNVKALIVQGDKDEVVTDDVSLYSKRSQITDPNVNYSLQVGADHNTVFASEASREYQQKLDDEWLKYKQDNDLMDATETEKAAKRLEWMKTINFDKALYNQLNDGIIQQMETMFSSK